MPQSGTERSLPRELANAARDTERQGVGLASLRASIKALVSVANAVGFASVASPKVLLLLLRVKRALMRSEA